MLLSKLRRYQENGAPEFLLYARDQVEWLEKILPYYYPFSSFRHQLYLLPLPYLFSQKTHNKTWRVPFLMSQLLSQEFQGLFVKHSLDNCPKSPAVPGGQESSTIQKQWHQVVEGGGVTDQAAGLPGNQFHWGNLNRSYYTSCRKTPEVLLKNKDLRKEGKELIRQKKIYRYIFFSDLK